MLQAGCVKIFEEAVAPLEAVPFREGYVLALRRNIFTLQV